MASEPLALIAAASFLLAMRGRANYQATSLKEDAVATLIVPEPVWKSAPDLMRRLADAQNHPAFADRDVLTFAAFFASRAELEAHVLACERVLASDRANA